MPSGFQAFGSAEGYVGSGASFSPIVFSPLLWVRADLGVTGTTTVTSWADQSGNGHDLTAGAGNEGALNAANSSLNNRPSITFDAGKYMATGAFAQAAANTIFFVGCRNNINGTTRCDGLAGDTFELYRPAGNQIRWFRGAVGCTMAAADDLLGHITIAEDNGASSKLYYDSLTEGVTGDAGAGAASGVTLAAHASGVAGYLGDVAEFIIYSSVLSAENRTLVTQYLATRYGITLV